MRRFVLALVIALVVPSMAHAQKIVIDAGHGGTDSGGTGNAMEEKDIVLDTTKRFKALLEKDTADTAGGGSWTALLTRSDDTFVSLAGRSSYSNAQAADRFMSIHSNAYSVASANGTETFAYSEGGTGAALRNLVQEEMITAWGLTNRGNKTANFAVLRDTAAPAELHELAFITNATDAAKLASPTEREKAAEAHLRAIQRHYGIPPYIPNGGTPPVNNLGSINGIVIDDLGPIEGATVQLDTGLEVVTPGDGSFVFEELAIGTHSITVTAANHESRTVDVTVAAGMVADTEIELVRIPGGGSGSGSGSGSGEGEGEGSSSAFGGCATGHGSGSAALLVFALGLLAAVRRARRG